MPERNQNEATACPRVAHRQAVLLSGNYEKVSAPAEERKKTLTIPLYSLTIIGMQTIPVETNLALEMAEKGVLSGHKKSKTHPHMKPYIGANRNEVEIMKPEAVAGSLARAIEFLREAKNKSKMVLCVGTTSPAIAAIEKMAGHFKFPLVTTRWIGGTLTNFKVIRERINYYLNLKGKKERGELGKYTKKERVDFDKELEKLAAKFDGLVGLSRTPDAIFIVDGKEHETALREAKRMGITVVMINDTDDDPKIVEYPIIASDHARSGIEWVVDRLISGIEAVQEPETAQEEVAVKASEEVSELEKNKEPEEVSIPVIHY